MADARRATLRPYRMVRCFRLTTILLIAALLVACRSGGPRAAIDPILASCIPPGTVAVAGVDLEALRKSPAFPKLPAAAVSILDPLKNASYALTAWNGKDLLFVARGDFHEVPAGSTLLDSHLALSGSPEMLQAATAQHKLATTGEPELLAHAESVAGGKTVWVVARGNANLPLAGNASNINRFLHYTDYTAFTAEIGDRTMIEATGYCRRPDAAARFEESLRAFLSLAAMGYARQPEIAALLKSAEVQREGTVVHGTLSAPTDEALRLLLGAAR
jgi:hypothetical protein